MERRIIHDIVALVIRDFVFISHIQSIIKIVAHICNPVTTSHTEVINWNGLYGRYSKKPM